MSISSLIERGIHPPAFGPIRRYLISSGFYDSPLFGMIAWSIGAPLIAILSWWKKMAFPQDCGIRTKLCYLNDHYELETITACRDFLKRGMNVLDIGANMGYYSRFSSKRVGHEGKVYAFEPDPATYGLLCHNTKRYANVVPVQKAVTNSAGTLELVRMSISSDNSLFHVPRPEHGSVLKERIQVQSTTIDAFLAERGNPLIGFIKMDIEGAESLALAGMEQTIARSPQLVLVVEFAPMFFEANGASPLSLLRRLRSMEFRIYGIGMDPDDFEKPHARIWGTNLLCLKNYPRQAV